MPQFKTATDISLERVVLIATLDCQLCQAVINSAVHETPSVLWGSPAEPQSPHTSTMTAVLAAEARVKYV